MWEGSPGVESFLTGRNPPFCVVSYPVLLCAFTFPLVCLCSLHLLTKVGLCCSEPLYPDFSPELIPCLKMIP